MTWTIPPQDGRVAVVTGANGGLGLATATALAGAGAHVVMAARDQAKARAARDRVLAEHPGASLEVVPLDLGSLDSVARAAAEIQAAHPVVDLLINNAGVMAMPYRQTSDGFESQLGINHLGHWALTAHLLPAVLRAPAARVVTLTSGAQHMGRPLDPSLRRKYGPWRAYADSKLADRHFAQGLDRQFRAAGAPAMALTAHPGLTNSDLQSHTVAEGGGGLSGRFFLFLTRTTGMSVAQGALCPLRAATDPQATGGTMYGPRWSSAGPPVRRCLIRPGSDRAIATLWSMSRRLTGLDIDVAQALAAARP
ncbi:SDR family NAD(P)-dependent oxidoreductase [Actinoplanes sp. NPDC051513]|uniref:SDR family NAD(P)-dependent oxidoreductase n=1 Tax=Actinoplanes sp. NPDC051513 TaxID=3363908 RepID=UPI0037AF4B2C